VLSCFLCSPVSQLHEGFTSWGLQPGAPQLVLDVRCNSNQAPAHILLQEQQQQQQQQQQRSSYALGARDV
jgi:hypothetical protein